MLIISTCFITGNWAWGLLCYFILSFFPSLHQLTFDPIFADVIKIHAQGILLVQMFGKICGGIFKCLLPMVLSRIVRDPNTSNFSLRGWSTKDVIIACKASLLCKYYFMTYGGLMRQKAAFMLYSIATSFQKMSSFVLGSIIHSQIYSPTSLLSHSSSQSSISSSISISSTMSGQAVLQSLCGWARGYYYLFLGGQGGITISIWVGKRVLQSLYLTSSEELPHQWGPQCIITWRTSSSMYCAQIDQLIEEG